MSMDYLIYSIVGDENERVRSLNKNDCYISNTSLKSYLEDNGIYLEQINDDNDDDAAYDWENLFIRKVEKQDLIEYILDV